jgi:hypothetical protein
LNILFISKYYQLLCQQHGKEADGSSSTQQTELLPGESLVVVHEGVVVGLNQVRILLLFIIC